MVVIFKLNDLPLHSLCVINFSWFSLFFQIKNSNCSIKRTTTKFSSRGRIIHIQTKEYFLEFSRNFLVTLRTRDLCELVSLRSYISYQKCINYDPHWRRWNRMVSLDSNIWRYFSSWEKKNEKIARNWEKIYNLKKNMRNTKTR